jgi:hypothetical protein
MDLSPDVVPIAYHEVKVPLIMGLNNLPIPAGPGYYIQTDGTGFTLFEKGF